MQERKRPKLIPRDATSKTRLMPVAGAVPPIGTPGPLKQLEMTEAQNALEARVAVDERPMKRLIKKSFAVLGLPGEDSDIELAGLATEISAMKVTLARLRTVAQVTSKGEQAEYENDSRNFEQTFRNGEEEIARLKDQLKEAQQERANKLEYDALAKQIAKYPSRAETEESMRRVRSQIEALREESEGYRDIASRIREKWVSAMENFGTLQTQISVEIAERERAAVERNEQLGDDDDDEDGTVDPSAEDVDETGKDEHSKRTGAAPSDEQELEEGEEGAHGKKASSRAADDEEEEEGAMADERSPHHRASSGALSGGSSRLNPGAQPFEPVSRSSSSLAHAARRGTKRDDNEEGATRHTHPLPKRPRRN
ncbi:hypothetical protein K437DRAFT_252871 [Tilletiaria anomala UBC 951]|uniref:Uncharacterized protein n=1 Tax=Tilletiaria anomala (strain ATCC 24038 / CBS 436.72 / UBC 951) TaxID=1037660 RepID=A0A066WHN4_TILAU|nr:uncharacterized protein K437DRAFT_252871 [Tilletiaria anomala UBC 951]KDN53512.1 hypothetical protein K437DRAFT_252871 [Tilletiaria anomala UBC 951]